jgi:leucyl/phenylalanyl-tRNA---protein transferase
MAIDLKLLLNAYRHGIFPMADSAGDAQTYWVEPKTRAIIPLDDLHISASLKKAVRQDKFYVTSDTAFERVIDLCAEPAADRDGTWINDEIRTAFLSLNARGIAHSVECWHGEALVGGLYGLAIGGLFCGESMFSRTTDASKVALVWLVARMRLGGFTLLDCQFMTDHLESLGAVEISQSDYVKQAARAIDDDGYSATASSVVGSGSVSSSGSGTGSDAAAGAARGVGADWFALDRVLVAAGARAAGASSSASSTGASLSPNATGGLSSPGKIILQSFTHTS